MPATSSGTSTSITATTTSEQQTVLGVLQLAKPEHTPVPTTTANTLHSATAKIYAIMSLAGIPKIASTPAATKDVRKLMLLPPILPTTFAHSTLETDLSSAWNKIVAKITLTRQGSRCT
ncbi:hypothetical protein B9Z65_7623 [Elsinoe australis]|uniref:Uncharacterized protein n=1 Tax=Elsinoe australis TaxID=40998 RepID=A0A2P8A028_9PEZI|nr:hypothetical protein B9Z65_7623 [Elsinoe australis]